MAVWPSWAVIAEPRDGKIKVLKKGTEPESLIRYQPVADGSQRLSWEWTARNISIRSGQVAPRGDTRTAKGVLETKTVAVDEDSFASRRSVNVSRSEPESATWETGFSETVTEDFSGRTRQIETQSDLAKARGVISPWVVHRALDIVLPDEPVGKDAQWRVTRSLEIDQGLTVDVEAIYELKQVTADSVGIVYSLDVKRVPAPAEYSRAVQPPGSTSPAARARNRLFVSMTCNGRAVQNLAKSLPDQGEVVCQVLRQWKRTSLEWAGDPSGEQINIKLGPADGS